MSDIVFIFSVIIAIGLCSAQIPNDWESYIAPDMVAAYRGKSTHSAFSGTKFQGDIAGIDKALVSSDGLNNVISDRDKKWPGGRVPFVFGPQFLDDDRREEKLKIKLAMDLIGGSSSQCIKFVQRKNETDYIYIGRGMDCSSSVGRQGGRQLVSLTIGGCLETIGGIQHELLHVLGFFHEMSRFDRDKYIWIDMTNVKEEFRKDFEIATDSDAAASALGYDYESVMHYPYNAFAINPFKPTIIPKRKGRRIGQNVGLSLLDIQKLRKAYDCLKEEQGTEVAEEIRETSFLTTMIPRVQTNINANVSGK